MPLEKKKKKDQIFFEQYTQESNVLSARPHIHSQTTKRIKDTSVSLKSS